MSFAKESQRFFSALNASAQENLEALSKAIYSCKNPESFSFPTYQNCARISVLFGACFDELRAEPLVKKSDPILLGEAGGFPFTFICNGPDDIVMIQDGLVLVAPGLEI